LKKRWEEGIRTEKRIKFDWKSVREVP